MMAGPIGAVMTLTVLAITFVGPFVEPHSPNALLGVPFSSPSAKFPLGTDVLGRDVLSQYLDGGYKLVIIAAIATFLGYALGGTIGLVAGFTRSFASPLLMRGVDVFLRLPRPYSSYSSLPQASAQARY